MTTKKFYLAITEDTIELATFLNDGVTPQSTSERPAHLVCEVVSSNEITTSIVDTHEFFGENPNHLLVIGYHE